MKRPTKTYFGIMMLSRYGLDGRLNDRWFIHYKFKSKYAGEEDCGQHDEDCWKAYFNLPAVKSCKQQIFDGNYASPSEWSYIREIGEVNTDGICMGKWVKSSPFFDENTWWVDKRK